MDNIKYLGVKIFKDLKWNTNVSNVCTKANRTLCLLRRNLSSCPQVVKEMAYKGLVRQILEYAGPVWDPCGIVVQGEFNVSHVKYTYLEEIQGYTYLYHLNSLSQPAQTLLK